MEDYRSKFYGDGSNMQIEPYHGPNDNFRSYSASSSYYHTAVAAAAVVEPPRKLKKGKSTGGSISKSWSLDDAELQRKKRIATYKAYSVEGKIKGSFRRSFRWIKDRCNMVIHGLW